MYKLEITVGIGTSTQILSFTMAQDIAERKIYEIKNTNSRFYEIEHVLINLNHVLFVNMDKDEEHS